MNKDNILAFPCVSGKSTEEGAYLQQGMNLRDYFAAQTIAVVLNLNVYKDADPATKDFAGQCAKMAYEIADAMLEERSKQP